MIESIERQMGLYDTKRLVQLLNGYLYVCETDKGLALFNDTAYEFIRSAMLPGKTNDFARRDLISTMKDSGICDGPIRNLIHEIWLEGRMSLLSKLVETIEAETTGCKLSSDIMRLNPGTKEPKDG